MFRIDRQRVKSPRKDLDLGPNAREPHPLIEGDKRGQRCQKNRSSAVGLGMLSRVIPLLLKQGWIQTSQQIQIVFFHIRSIIEFQWFHRMQHFIQAEPAPVQLGRRGAGSEDRLGLPDGREVGPVQKIEHNESAAYGNNPNIDLRRHGHRRQRKNEEHGQIAAEKDADTHQNPDTAPTEAQRLRDALDENIGDKKKGVETPGREHHLMRRKRGGGIGREDPRARQPRKQRDRRLRARVQQFIFTVAARRARGGR